RQMDADLHLPAVRIGAAQLLLKLAVARAADLRMSACRDLAVDRDDLAFLRMGDQLSILVETVDDAAGIFFLSQDADAISLMQILRQTDRDAPVADGDDLAQHDALMIGTDRIHHRPSARMKRVSFGKTTVKELAQIPFLLHILRQLPLLLPGI